MMHWKGPYSFAGSLNSGRCIEDLPDRPGVYRISINEQKYNVDLHGPSRVIHIGSVGETGGISKRVGEFMAASMGYGVYHSAGSTFANSYVVLSLTVRDLEYEFSETSNFKEMEAMLFDEFESKVRLDREQLEMVRRKVVPKKAHLPYPILCKARPRRT